MWSTTVASVVRPFVEQRRHSGSVARCCSRAACQRRPYPRLAAEPRAFSARGARAAGRCVGALVGMRGILPISGADYASGVARPRGFFGVGTGAVLFLDLGWYRLTRTVQRTRSPHALHRRIWNRDAGRGREKTTISFVDPQAGQVMSRVIGAPKNCVCDPVTRAIAPHFPTPPGHPRQTGPR